MTYTFKIDLNDGNGLKDFSYHNITFPFIGFSDKTNLNEELDNGFFEVISLLEEIPIWSYIEYTIDNEKRFFYVGNDESERLTKDEEKYLHKLELIEITKKLEKYPLETICFTQSQNKNVINYTLWDVLQRIFRIYEIQEDNRSNWDLTNYEDLPNLNNNKILENIDEEIKDYLKSIEAPTLVLNNLTLREAFDECFKYVNAICTMKDRYTLTCEFFNKIKDLINYNNKQEGFITSSSVEDYSTELQSFVENQITESSNELYSIIHPSKLGFVGLRTKENNYSLNDSNFGILLNYPIYNIQDFVVRVRIEANPGQNEKYDNIEVSIKNFVAEQQVYNKLQYKKLDDYKNEILGYAWYGGSSFSTDNIDYIDSNLYKTNTVNYSFKDNFVDLSETQKGFLLNFHPLSTAIVQSVAKYVIKNFEKYESEGWFPHSQDLQTWENRSINVYAYREGTTGDLFSIGSLTFGIPEQITDLDNYYYGTYKFSIEKINANLINESYIKNDILKFRVSYQTINSLRLSVNKNDISDTKIKTSSFSNQNNRIVSLQNISNNMKSNIERIGNYEYSITIRHNNISEIFNKGDFIRDGNDIYICVIRETIYYNDFILCKYLFTKNYSRLNEFIGINSQIRQWQIPSGNETYERIIKKDSYCFISLDNYILNIKTENNKFPGYTYTNTRKKIFDLFSENNNPINNVFFNSEDDVNSIDFDLKSDVEQYWNELVPGSNTLELECISEGTKDALIFNFGFNDNISAGYMLEKDDSGLKTLMLKVPYANPTEGNRLGFLRNCAFTLTTGNVDFDTSNLPLTYVDFNSTSVFNEIMFDISDQLILKDPAEILKFSFQLNFINKSINDFIIGEAFGKYNPLVYNGIKKVYLYLFVGSSIIGDSFNRNNIFKAQGIKRRELTSSDIYINDNIIQNDDLTKTIYTTFDLTDDVWSEIKSYSNTLPYGRKIYWISLGTEDGDLLFAIKYNGKKRSIFLQFSNKREDLVEKY